MPYTAFPQAGIKVNFHYLSDVAKLHSKLILSLYTGTFVTFGFEQYKLFLLSHFWFILSLEDCVMATSKGCAKRFSL